MKTEWWYDDWSYHLDNSGVYLARLTVRDDGTAQVITAGEIHEFENEDEASIWLGDEEYSLLEVLFEILVEEGRPVDPRITPPTAATDEELMHKMAIKLDPANGATAPTQPSNLPTQT